MSDCKNECKVTNLKAQVFDLLVQQAALAQQHAQIEQQKNELLKQVAAEEQKETVVAEYSDGRVEHFEAATSPETEAERLKEAEESYQKLKAIARRIALEKRNEFTRKQIAEEHRTDAVEGVD